MEYENRVRNENKDGHEHNNLIKERLDKLNENIGTEKTCEKGHFGR